MVLWFQIIDKAKEEKRPIIFVTDDTKEDWWEEIMGKTIGPRPELMQEFFSKTGKFFYMYKSDIFMTRAGDYLEQEVDQKTVDEIRELRTSDEKTQVTTKGVQLYEELEKFRLQEQHLESDIRRLETEIMRTRDEIRNIEHELATGGGRQPRLMQLAMEGNRMRLINKYEELQNEISKFRVTCENVQKMRAELERVLKYYLISPE